jgi:hypothetical protein
MDYPTYVTTMSNMMVLDPTDANFQQILPSVIQSAEQRIYRDLDLISTIVTDTSMSTTSGARNITVPPAFVVVEYLNTLDASGARLPMTPAGRAFLDTVFGDSTVQGRPAYYAMVTQNSMVLGPVPDAPYTIEVVGTQRPAPISGTNLTTFISANLWDLFIAASMIFAAGYLKNYGATSDNPQMAVSWGAQYSELLKAANVEELRKKHQSQAWSAQMPTPATPQQG